MANYEALFEDEENIFGGTPQSKFWDIALQASDEIVKEEFEKIMQKFIEYNIDFKGKTVFFPVWKKPYIAAGGNTFINSVLELINLRNVFKSQEGSYPKISRQDIIENCPDFIFLTQEPYRFTEKDAKEFAELCPGSKPVFVDGEMFIWYGSRLLLAADYFKELFEKLIS